MRRNNGEALTFIAHHVPGTVLMSTFHDRARRILPNPWARWSYSRFVSEKAEIQRPAKPLRQSDLNTGLADSKSSPRLHCRAPPFIRRAAQTAFPGHRCGNLELRGHGPPAGCPGISDSQAQRLLFQNMEAQVLCSIPLVPSAPCNSPSICSQRTRMRTHTITTHKEEKGGLVT